MILPKYSFIALREFANHACVSVAFLLQLRPRAQKEKGLVQRHRVDAGRARAGAWAPRLQALGQVFFRALPPRR